MERQLLSALMYDRSAYDTLRLIIDEKQDLSEQGKLIYQQISRIYDNDKTTTSCDVELIVLHFQTATPKHAEMFENLVRSLERTSIPNVIDFFVEYKRDRLGTQLAESLLNPNSKNTQQLIEQYSTCATIVASKAEEEVDEVDLSDIEALSNEFKKENLVPIYPRDLNAALGGGVPRQSHILVYGTPDSGKTAMGISITAGFLANNKKVLYIGNEDSKRLMAMRFYARMTGLPMQSILADIDGARRLAYDRGLGNLSFVSRSPGYIGEIPKLIERYKPDCIVVDQIHNLRHSQNLGKVERLEALCYEMRNYIKAADIVGVSLTQAADSAYGKLVLDIDDVYYSNIAVQANVDLMIGISSNEEYLQLGKRMLSVTKNKMNDFHGHIPVDISPAISKIY